MTTSTVSWVSDQKRLSEQEADKLAALHIRALPDSAPARLGHYAVVAFYRTVIASPAYALGLARRGNDTDEPGRLIGAIVLHECEGGLAFGKALLSPAIGPMIRGAFPGAARLLKSALAGREQGRRETIIGLPEVFGSLPDGDTGARTPEITHIFVDADLRNGGVGHSFTAAAEKRAIARGCSEMFVRTLAEDGNRAVKFYLREGYRAVALTGRAKRRMVLFQKSLRPTTL